MNNGPAERLNKHKLFCAMLGYPISLFSTSSQQQIRIFVFSVVIQWIFIILCSFNSLFFFFLFFFWHRLNVFCMCVYCVHNIKHGHHQIMYFSIISRYKCLWPASGILLALMAFCTFLFYETKMMSRLGDEDLNTHIWTQWYLFVIIYTKRTIINIERMSHPLISIFFYVLFVVSIRWARKTQNLV